MNNYIDIFLEFLFILCNALLLFRICEDNLHSRISFRARFIYIILSMFSILPKDITIFEILSFLTPMFFLIAIFKKSVKSLFMSLIKYISIISLFVPIAVIQSILLQDAAFALGSQKYLHYKIATIFICIYNIYVLFSNAIHKKYVINFYSVTFAIIFLGLNMVLDYITLSICLENPNSYKLIVIFSIIFLLLILCTSLYDKFLAVIDENTNYRIRLELDKMEKEYSTQIDDKLKQLHSLRHDIKNHLIIIYGYAPKKETNKICAYINRITSNLSLTDTIDSGSHIVSALISEKEESAKSKNIKCDINIITPEINIDDFSITTIIGNLFDNAITAASECEHGWIRFNLSQTSSYMNIVIENSYYGDIIETNGEFTSTKNGEQTTHGIGIKNVRKVVSDLNGQINFSYNNEYFSVKAEIPNYT